jgi:hypothetical protein
MPSMLRKIAWNDSPISSTLENPKVVFPLGAK